MITMRRQGMKLLGKESRVFSGFKKLLPFASCALVGTECRVRTGPGI